MKMKKYQKIIGLFLSTILLISCGEKITESTINLKTNSEPDTLTIWWNKSYYIQEDEAIESIISAWQRKTGKKVSLSLMSQDDIIKDTENAMAAGNPPDIVFAQRADDSSIPRWAWDGKLADISDVIEPLKETYSNAALQSVYLYNQQNKQRSYYAVPFEQQTIHIHYWRDLLTEAGFKEADIPTEWDDFWAFWQQVQDNLRAKGREEIYSFGFPMSREASDTHNLFDQILEAYDVQLLDETGHLLPDNPQTRQGIIQALRWYTQFYLDGYVPQDADDWTSSSNNIAFLNQNTILTINPSLSIPGSQREDPDIYYNQIASIAFPQEPDGEQIKQIVSMKQVVLFKASPHTEVAKDFLSYFVQPEHLSTYLESSLGRFFPVMPVIASKPFWNNPNDPHIFTANQQFNRDTRASYQSLNPAYMQVQAEVVWGQAIERIILEGWSAEKATEEAYVRIEEIFTQWQQ